MSRDPIEEGGGLHLYGFVGNAPTGAWDYLGQVCCTQELIDKGGGALLDRYAKAKVYLESRKVRHRGRDDASCIGVNLPVLRFMSPPPDCWKCRLEHRERWVGFPVSTYYDHWAVVCWAEQGKAPQLLFDYWGDRPGGEDPKAWFRVRYPIFKKDSLVITDPKEAEMYEFLDVLPCGAK